jgi:uncharacterized protein (DUF39 family)
MSSRSPSPQALAPRSEAELCERQGKGTLQVRTAADYRQLVHHKGLAAAYAATDVVVAANAEFTDQASLVLSLGPVDPPIRMREPALGGVAALAGGGGGELVLPIGSGQTEPQRRSGAQVLATLLAGESVELSAGGEATPLQPRRDLHLRLTLDQIGAGRLLLHRGIVENGVVAVSSAEGVLRSPYGPLLGPYANALYTCAGADSIGLAMPGLGLLGPGSPVLVGGAVGWVIGSGSGHLPGVRRLAGGQARTPGAVAALSVDLHALQPNWVRACWFEGHGSALLVAMAAPIPLINGAVALQASVDNDVLEAPVLDVSIPRRLKPSFGGISYRMLRSGHIEVDGRRLPAAPAHSPRLAAEIAAELVERLRGNRFPLRLPLEPLSERAGLIPLES